MCLVIRLERRDVDAAQAAGQKRSGASANGFVPDATGLAAAGGFPS